MKLRSLTVMICIILLGRAVAQTESINPDRPTVRGHNLSPDASAMTPRSCVSPGQQRRPQWKALTNGKIDFASPAPFGATGVLREAYTPWEHVVMAAAASSAGASGPRQVVNTLAAPTLVTTTLSATWVYLCWTAVAGATRYDIERRTNNGPFVDLAGYTTTETEGSDIISPNATYLYRIVASNETESSVSNIDLATTLAFQDDPIFANVTLIKDYHITELRTAVNLVRASVGLPPAIWTHPTITAQKIRSEEINDLRTALDAAVPSAEIGPRVYTDVPLLKDLTGIKKAHTEELRQAVKGVSPPGIGCAPNCGCVAGCACNGHKHLSGSSYPYTEDVGSNIPVRWGDGYVTVAQGCLARSYINFSNSAPVNAVMRAWIKISASTAPVGSRIAFRFNVDGVIRGQYLRALTGQYPQGQDVGAVYVDLPIGNHRMKVQVWVVDGPGEITVGQAFLTAQGSPTGYGGGTIANPNTMTVDGTWRQITDTLSFDADTDVNLEVQGYFQVNSGTPGHKLSVGFSLDGAISQRTIELGVPAQMPSGINIFDHYKYKPGYIQVPHGNHTISLWAMNADGGSATVQFREVEVIGFSALDDTQTPMIEAIATNPLYVSSAGDQSTVFNVLLLGCAPWTKLLEYTYPAISPDQFQNMVGDAYIEFLGTADGQPQLVDVAIEVLYKPTYDASGNPIGREADADFTIVSLMIPPGRHQKFIYTHPLWWGTNEPNLLRMFVRKQSCNGQPPGEFTVGKRYMAIKAVTTGMIECQYD